MLKRLSAPFNSNSDVPQLAVTSPLLTPGVLSNNQGYFPPPVPQPAGIERPVLQKTIRNIEAFIAALDDYRQLIVRLANTEKQLYRSCKDISKSMTGNDLIASSFAATASLFETVASIDGKFAKSSQKEYETINEVCAKYFKKIAKAERAHDELLSSLDSKLKKTNFTYDKRLRTGGTMSPAMLADLHTQFLPVLSGITSQIATARSAHAIQMAIKRDALAREIAASIASIAEAEWKRSVENTKRAGVQIGEVVRWQASCWSAAMPSEMPKDLEAEKPPKLPPTIPTSEILKPKEPSLPPKVTLSELLKPKEDNLPERYTLSEILSPNFSKSTAHLQPPQSRDSSYGNLATVAAPDSKRISPPQSPPESPDRIKRTYIDDTTAKRTSELRTSRIPAPAARESSPETSSPSSKGSRKSGHSEEGSFTSISSDGRDIHITMKLPRSSSKRDTRYGSSSKERSNKRYVEQKEEQDLVERKRNVERSSSVQTTDSTKSFVTKMKARYLEEKAAAAASSITRRDERETSPPAGKVSALTSRYNQFDTIRRPALDSSADAGKKTQRYSSSAIPTISSISDPTPKTPGPIFSGSKVQHPDGCGCYACTKGHGLMGTRRMSMPVY